MDLAPFIAHAGYGQGSATLTKLTLGAAGGVTLDGSGAIDRAANSGRLAVNASAPALPALTRLMTPLLPDAVAARLAALPADGAAKVKFSLTLDKSTEADRINALATADANPRISRPRCGARWHPPSPRCASGIPTR